MRGGVGVAGNFRDRARAGAKSPDQPTHARAGRAARATRPRRRSAADRQILAIELVADPKTRRPFAACERRGLRAYRYALEHGVVLRPLGDILYWMPPYCVGEPELRQLAEVTIGAVNEATG